MSLISRGSCFGVHWHRRNGVPSPKKKEVIFVSPGKVLLLVVKSKLRRFDLGICGDRKTQTKIHKSGLWTIKALLCVFRLEELGGEQVQTAKRTWMHLVTAILANI